MKTAFDSSRLDEIFTHLHALNITDPNPAEACEYLVHNKYIDSVCVTSGKMVSEMISSIMTVTQDDFRARYCEAPMFILNVREDDLSKDAFSHELVLILSVRRYKHLPTIFVSTEKISSLNLKNISLSTYMTPTDKIRP